MRLPELLIIGAQKCGTTALHEALCRHPDIHSAIDPTSGQIVKELHYFSLNFDKGIDWYGQHFGSERGLYVDASPSYLCHEVVAPRLEMLVRDSKLVVSLRDPVRRAFSQFNHYTQQQDIAGDWDWRRPGESFQANIDAEFIEPRNNWFGFLKRGFYDEQLLHLLCYFPRDQIHVMVMERWTANPAESLERLLEFTELPPCDLEMQPVHAREYTVDPLSREIERQLREIYQPHNDRLFDLLGESIDEW